MALTRHHTKLPLHVYFYILCSVVSCCYCYSFAQSYLTLCNPMDCRAPGFPVLHCLPEFAQVHIHWVSDAVPTISSPTALFSFCLQSFPASRSFPRSPLLSCLILHCPLFLLPSIFPGIKIFPNESTLVSSPVLGLKIKEGRILPCLLPFSQLLEQFLTHRKDLHSTMNSW